MSGYGEARPIGRMIPQQATSQPPPRARCTTCGCWLSRYRNYSDKPVCAPCQDTAKRERDAKKAAEPFYRNPPHENSARIAQRAALAVTGFQAIDDEPYLPPCPEPRRHYMICECGRAWRKKQSMRCLTCRREQGSNLPAAIEQKLKSGCYDWCECRRELKRRKAKRCRKCYERAARTPGSLHSATCKCGGVKAKESLMCWSCRYPKARAA